MWSEEWRFKRALWGILRLQCFYISLMEVSKTTFPEVHQEDEVELLKPKP